MSIGERLLFFRKLRNITQKKLGIQVGFTERNAESRMTQYENNRRTPKEELIKAFAHFLDVSPDAISVPDIDSYMGVMFTLFAIEDRFGITHTIDDNGKIYMDITPGIFQPALNKTIPQDNPELNTLYRMIRSYAEQTKKYLSGEITKEEYDEWRYHYPEHDTHGKWAKTIPKGIFD